MSLRFEWDPKKAKTNQSKHGISFEEALTVFANPLARIFPDEEHSVDEPARDHHRLLRTASINPGELYRHRQPGANFQRTQGDASGTERL